MRGTIHFAGKETFTGAFVNSRELLSDFPQARHNGQSRIHRNSLANHIIRDLDNSSWLERLPRKLGQPFALRFEQLTRHGADFSQRADG